MKKENYTDRAKWAVRALGLAAVVVLLWWLLFAEKNNYAAIETDSGIDITPEQIQNIRSIGQWEFLSVSTEEMVDTVRKGLLSNDQLVRIYYGTMRLGVDMTRAELTAQGDSVTLVLPRVGLLDANFIDEARTKSFYESGRWQPRDREALYEKARRQMLRHGLTKENLQAAEQNAGTQVRRLLKSMGYNHINIKWTDLTTY